MAIRIEHLCKRFGSFVVLDDVSFAVPRGELVALLGPSGGGKSTILRIIAGLDFADCGKVYIDNIAVDHLDSKARQVGFVFQHYALFRHMSVASNIAFGLSVQGVPRIAQRERVRELLSLVGLHGLGDRYPNQLSGGQRQRVALARALAPKPRLLLLDEPFGAVDTKVRKELRRWLRRLHDEVHVTSVFVTHDQDEAFDVADQVVIVNQGRIEQAASPPEIIEQPASEFVASFFGEVNIFNAIVQDGQAIVGALTTPVDDIADGTNVHLLVRSYDFKLWQDENGVGTIKRITSLGDRVSITADIDGVGMINAHFPQSSDLLDGLNVGSRIAAEIAFARAYPV
ncbi:MAG: sulfate ABC transporter ATP-binding protein [Deltaproteobacteria bacterium]|nr:sulfate ABC transporter ATP-binding protein [Deltaproteobacteria bacterium]